jgi:hypothetical protein
MVKGLDLRESIICFVDWSIKDREIEGIKKGSGESLVFIGIN